MTQMGRLGRRLGALFFVSLLTIGKSHSVARAADEAPEAKAGAEIVFATPTANVFGLSLAYQAPLSIDKAVPLGGGLTYTREYFVTQRTALGIHVALRVFPDDPLQLALGYGLTFKHYLGHQSLSRPTSGFYLLYGLLLQMNYLKGREGTATGHDTRLAAGYDWQSGNLFPTIELGYHLTQVRSFDTETLWWPYTEVVTGIRF